MAIEQAPVRRRIVGAALRRYRQQLGLGLDDVARALECDCSKVSRIETGQRGIRAKELRELLAEYGVEEHEQHALQALADPRGAQGWWQEYADVLPEATREYLALEATATQVLVYDGQQVPALLQTEEHAHAIAAADPMMPAGLQARAVEAVLARQQMTTAQHPDMTVVIGEGALRQQVGGAKAMRAQLGHLAAVSESSGGITIQVLPFASGAHAAAGTGPAAVLRFSQAPGLGVVQLASLSGGVFLEDELDIAVYVRALMQLRASALPPGESGRLLRAMAEEP
jgi:transcriptional regulator with XRE-family HTH domain